ncbi:MAG TPA: lactonase family protein [Bryobacteraceae bacterium]|nr:lactonase family protein [Bryobacteraceae bacterium]
MKTCFAIPLFAVLSTTMSTSSHLSGASTGAQQQSYFVYLGSYGQGIQGYRFDAANGALESIGLAGKVENPSWITADRDYRHLYAVSELQGNQNGGVASFAIDRKSGKLTSLNQVSSKGKAPCHASVDATGRMIVVANYTTGDAVSFAIEKNGSLSEAVSIEKAHGSGPNKERQEGPHAHEAVITRDNTRVYVPDLGLDEIRIYKIDPATAKLTPNDPPNAKAEAGSGPRHIVFDHNERYAYVMHELKPFVSVFRRDPATGALERIQEVRTIRRDFTKENTGAEIRIDAAGKFLYTSNRGEDSIQVFAIDSATGKLNQVQNISTEGQQPRGFALDPTGRFLLAGNQKSNTLVVFKVDPSTGKLTPAGKKIETPSPVDVFFVPAS